MMASITLTGTLLDPTGEVAVGDQIRFTHRTTTGETIQFARSVLIIPPSGMYNFTLEFGLIFVEYLDVKDVNYKPLGVVTVNGDTTATDLPALLNAIVPPTDAQLLLFQAILQDTEDARDIALLAAAQQTTLELIASTVIHPAGTVLTLSGFTLSGDGGGAQWKLNGVVGQTVSQTPAQLGDALLNDASGNQWELVTPGVIQAKSLGLNESDTTVNQTLSVQAGFNRLMQNAGGTIELGTGVFDFNDLLLEFKSDLTEADGKRKTGGIHFIGVGASNNDSVTETDADCTVKMTSTTGGLISLDSLFDVSIENMLMIYDSATANHLVEMKSKNSPIPTSTNVTFKSVIFRADQVPATAQVIVRDIKAPIFEKCRWVTSDGFGLVLGENSGVNATLVDGKAIRPTFRDCVFAADISIKRAELVLFDNCEWFPAKGTTRSANIVFNGDKFIATLTFENCKAFNDGDGAGNFCDMSATTGKGGLILQGGHFGDHLNAFITAPRGPVIIEGTRFKQDATGAHDVIITDGAAPVFIRADHTDTLDANEVPILDNRTALSNPWFVSQGLSAPHTFTTNTFETVLSQSSVKFLGGFIRVSYNVVINSLRGTRYSVQLKIGGNVIAETGSSTTIPNGNTGAISFDRVIPDPLISGSVTVQLAVRQFSNGGADFAIIQIDGGEFSSFLTIENV
jgi:hypothetical protein